MFGRMMVEPIVQVEPGVNLEKAIAALTNITENVEIARWIELPASVLLFLVVPGDPESGAVYVLDRKKGIWYAVDFEDEQFGGYSVKQLEMLLREGHTTQDKPARQSPGRSTRSRKLQLSLATRMGLSTASKPQSNPAFRGAMNPMLRRFGRRFGPWNRGVGAERPALSRRVPRQQEGRHKHLWKAHRNSLSRVLKAQMDSQERSKPSQRPIAATGF